MVADFANFTFLKIELPTTRVDFSEGVLFRGENLKRGLFGCAMLLLQMFT